MKVKAGAPMMLAQCDRNLHYRYVNRIYAETFGLPAEEIVGRRINEVLGDEAVGMVLPRIDEVLRGKVVEFEAQIPFSRIGLRWMRVIYIPHFDDDGTVRGWVAAITPIDDLPHAVAAAAPTESALK